MWDARVLACDEGLRLTGTQQDPRVAEYIEGMGAWRAELDMLLEEDPALRDAWERLTPGRRRGWLLHFNGAKQSKTRVARIERATPRIFEGFGMHD